MATAIRETEWKYDAALDSALPDLAGLPGVATQSEPEELVLEATYYDTDELDLARADVTLRQRSGGDDAGWHLKLPERPGVRTELRLPPGGEVPEEFKDLLTARLRGRPLGPVARITTRRRRRRLRDQAGAGLAEVVVDSVTAETFGDATTLTRWSEVELELDGGGQRLLKAADKRLRRIGLRRSHRSSKLEAALSGRLPETRPAPRLRPSSSAGDVMVAYLRGQFEELLSWDPLVRRDEPDSVHKMRVTARRLRSALQSFQPLLRSEGKSGGEVKELIGELRWLGAVLSGPRDAEVLREHLVSSLTHVPAELALGPVQARVTGHYAPRQAAAREEMLAALGSDRYRALLDRLERFIADAPLAPAARRPATEALPPLVWKTFRRLRRRMDAATRASDGPARDRALHEARKAAKRARYAAEAVSPAAGKKARRTAKALKKVQTELGAHQDTVIAREEIRQLGIRAHADNENAFTYGLLHEREAAQAATARRQGRRAWKKAGRGKRIAWMRSA